MIKSRIPTLLCRQDLTSLAKSRDVGRDAKFSLLTLGRDARGAKTKEYESSLMDLIDTLEATRPRHDMMGGMAGAMLMYDVSTMQQHC
jgi:hypothetical protein